MTPKRQQEAIYFWKIEGPKRRDEYKKANKIQVVPMSDFKKYDQLLVEVRNSLSLPAVPTMACLTKAQVNANFSRDDQVFDIWGKRELLLPRAPKT